MVHVPNLSVELVTVVRLAQVVEAVYVLAHQLFLVDGGIFVSGF